jgi:hypothetical protein
MAIPSWPNALPQNLLSEGYNESLRDNVLRSTPDAGPAKVRRRATAGVKPVSGRQALTTTELQALITFYETDLLDGSLRFSWTSPIDGTTAVEMRFTSPPSWSAIEPGLWDVAIAVEVLP